VHHISRGELLLAGGAGALGLGAWGCGFGGDGGGTPAAQGSDDRWTQFSGTTLNFISENRRRRWPSRPTSSRSPSRPASR